MSSSAPLRSASSLLDFLVASRRALLANARQREVHFVIGNEACDCDSVVSALAHAYHLHAERPPFLPPSALVAPIVSCTRAQWPLRREAASLLAEALLDPAPRGGAEAASALGAVLLFLDDVAPVAAAPAVARATVSLTDHNRLDGGGAALGLRGGDVVEIVDHHEDQGAHAHVAGAARVVAYDAAARKGVGSACTLVAGALLRGGGGVDARLARLLLGVVLLDTCGLAPAAGKTTGEDLRVAAALRERCGVGEAEGEALYRRLCALRFAPDFWRALPPAVALEYDYKGFGELGTAAICEPAGDFLLRGGGGGGGGALGAGAPLAACAAAAAQRRHALFLLLSMAPADDNALVEGTFLRQLAVVLPPRGAPGAARARHALAQLRACALLQLAEVAAGRTAEGWEGVLFAQGNAVASRKQVVPLVQAWLKEAPAGDEN